MLAVEIWFEKVQSMQTLHVVILLYIIFIHFHLMKLGKIAKSSATTSFPCLILHRWVIFTFLKSFRVFFWPVYAWQEGLLWQKYRGTEEGYESHKLSAQQKRWAPAPCSVVCKVSEPWIRLRPTSFSCEISMYYSRENVQYKSGGP